MKRRCGIANNSTSTHFLLVRASSFNMNCLMTRKQLFNHVQACWLNWPWKPCVNLTTYCLVIYIYHQYTNRFELSTRWFFNVFLLVSGHDSFNWLIAITIKTLCSLEYIRFCEVRLAAIGVARSERGHGPKLFREFSINQFKIPYFWAHEFNPKYFFTMKCHYIS